MCRSGQCKVELVDLHVLDESRALSLSRHLAKGTVLARLKDSHWRKEVFLVVNILRSVCPTAAM
jgi:hypothetical protein